MASPGVPGEVWAHYSNVHASSGTFRSLEPGESVLFTREEFDQDGYSYRALRICRPGGPEPDWENDGDEDEGGDEEQYIRIEFDHG